jgi:hypothetical protein
MRGQGSREETTYYVPPGDFARLVTYDDVDDDGGTVHGEFFVTGDIPIDRLVITEGTLLIVRLEDISSVQSRFSPSARFALQTFLHSNDRLPQFFQRPVREPSVTIRRASTDSDRRA